MNIKSFMLNNPVIILYLLIKKSIEFPHKKQQNLEELVKLACSEFVSDLEICRLLTTEHITVQHVPCFWKFYLGFLRNNYLTKSDKEAIHRRLAATGGCPQPHIQGLTDLRE